LFCGPASQWVRNPELALDFQTLERAEQRALLEQLALEIVLSYDNPRCELALPVTLVPSGSPSFTSPP
jgi:hypothetical protein